MCIYFVLLSNAVVVFFLISSQMSEFLFLNYSAVVVATFSPSFLLCNQIFFEKKIRYSLVPPYDSSRAIYHNT